MGMDKNDAALLIQKIGRGYLGRKKAKGKKNKKKQDYSAKVLQKTFKKYAKKIQKYT